MVEVFRWIIANYKSGIISREQMMQQFMENIPAYCENEQQVQNAVRIIKGLMTDMQVI